MGSSVTRPRIALGLPGGERACHPVLIVTIDCAAIPEHLLESELFGYARGAPGALSIFGG